LFIIIWLPIIVEIAIATEALILMDDFNDKFVLSSRVFPDCSVFQVNKTHQLGIYYPNREKLINSQNTKEIDARKHPLEVEDEYLKIDRTNFHIVVINANIGSQIIINKYKDFVALSPTIIFYPRIG